MPKTSLQNSIIREKRKILLMDTALRLFASYGVDNVTIDNITDALEISHGLFYHYFKDKTELLNLILGQVDLYLMEKIKPLLTNKSDSINLKNFALGFARETAVSSQSYGGVLSSPHVPLPSSNEESRAEHTRALYQIPKEIILHGQETGEFTDAYSADLLTTHLVTCLRGYAMDWARRSYGYDIENHVSSFMDIFCRALTLRQ